ncbi:MAG: hypothetical protein H7290_16310, partial [Flavobacterium sp.]|nr:hypothetical protein [Aeromicrobium sp.]
EVRWNGSPGDLLIIPDARHALEAVEDSVVLLSVAKTITPATMQDVDPAASATSTT